MHETYKALANYCFSASLAIWAMPGALIIAATLDGRIDSSSPNFTEGETIVLISSMVLSIILLIVGVIIMPKEKV